MNLTKKILKKVALTRDWTQVTYTAVKNANHYTKVSLVFVWDSKWNLINAWVTLSNWSNSSYWTKNSFVLKKPDCHQIKEEVSEVRQ